MRKTAILFALSAVVACAKAEPEERLAPVTFRIGNVITGDIATRSAADVLTASAPAGPFTVKLRSTTNPNRTYSVTAGDEVAVALDTYSATCNYYPAESVRLLRGRLYAEPCFYASATITVNGDGAFTIPASYDCAALIIDRTKAAAYTVRGASDYEAIANWTNAGDFGVVYYYPPGWSDTSASSLIVTPADDVNFGETTFSYTTAPVAGSVRLQPGKWYIFNPEAVETASGEIGFDYPGWEAGEV